MPALNGESIEPTKTLSSRLRQAVSRVALSTSLMIGGGTALGVGTELSDSEPAAAETGGYPWIDAEKVSMPPALDTITWGYKDKATCDNKSSDYDCSSSMVGDYYYRDQWGYDLRNCTSYAAWRVAKEFGVNIPSDWGHASTWDTGAAADNYEVDSTPEPGDLAVWDSTHVAFVEATYLQPDGSYKVKVSEYNQMLDGNFRNDRVVKADHYIDINGKGTGLNGQAVASNPAPAAPTTYSRSEARRAADFNGDGYDDIYATGQRADEAQNEIVYRGGNWLGPGGLWATPPATSIKYKDVLNLTADINGDGKDDLITIKNKDGEGNPIILWQKSTGSSFASPLEVGIPSLISKNTRWAAGDVTGDGKDDILAFSKRGDKGINIFVFRSLTSWLGAMEFWGNTNEEIQFESTRMLPGDFNGDGKEDLYAISKGNGGTQPHLFRLKSNGQNFEPGVLTRIINDTYENVNFTAVDLDADGKTDLLASSKRSDAHPNLVAHLSDGANGYKPNGGLWSAPSELKWDEARFIPADLDRDGDKDLIAVQSSGTHSGNPQLWWVKNNRTHFARPVLVGQPNVQWGTYHYGY